MRVNAGISSYLPVATAPKDSPNANSPMISKLSLLNHYASCQFDNDFLVEANSPHTSFIFNPSDEFMLCFDSWDTNISHC